jgi:hypothetical protein
MSAVQSRLLSIAILLACALGPLTLTACATGKGAAAPRVLTRENAPTWKTSDDPLGVAMRAIARQIERAGAAPGHEAFGGFLSTGGRSTNRFELAAKTCTTLVALAAAGVHDMDAAVYGPEGDLIAADSQPDAHPTIQLCAGETPRTLYYALHVYEGAGSFLVVPFMSAPEAFERIAAGLGVRPAVARLDPDDVTTKERLADFRDGLVRRGFSALDRPLDVPLADGQRMRIALPVEAGQCYTAGSFAREGLAEVNLRVVDDEGSEVARDETAGADSSLQFCADRPGQYAAELLSKDGIGVSTLLLFRAPAAVVGGPTGLWLGERPLARASLVPLEQAVAELGARAARDGYRTARTLRVGRLMPGEAVAEAATLPANKCARVVAAGGQGVRLFALRALDAQGHTISSAQGDARSTYLHLCSDAQMPVRLQLHALAGSGRFALTWHEAPLAAVPPVQAADALRARLLQAEQLAGDAGYHRHPSFAGGPLAVSLKRAEPFSVPLNTSGNQCVRAYVISSDRDAYGELVSGSKRLGEPASDSEPALFCAPAGAQAGAAELRIASENADTEAWLLVLVK